MYSIIRTRDFEKSYKKIKRSGYLKAQIKNKLEETIEILASGQRLSMAHQDHRLMGDLQHYRECHIKGDLLLIYQIRKEELLLILVDLGAHSSLRV